MVLMELILVMQTYCNLKANMVCWFYCKRYILSKILIGVSGSLLNFNFRLQRRQFGQTNLSMRQRMESFTEDFTVVLNFIIYLYTVLCSSIKGCHTAFYLSPMILTVFNQIYVFHIHLSSCQYMYFKWEEVQDMKAVGPVALENMGSF